MFSKPLFTLALLALAWSARAQAESPTFHTCSVAMHQYSQEEQLGHPIDKSFTYLSVTWQDCYLNAIAVAKTFPVRTDVQQVNSTACGGIERCTIYIGPTRFLYYAEWNFDDGFLLWHSGGSVNQMSEGAPGGPKQGDQIFDEALKPVKIYRNGIF